MLVCQEASRRTPATSDSASVVLLCPFFHYSWMVAGACGRSTVITRPTDRDAQRNQSRQGYEAFARNVLTSAAWNASRPHIHLGMGDKAGWMYAYAGSPLGSPPPQFVIHANPSPFVNDKLPQSVGHWHIMIPYPPVLDLMTLAAKSRADQLGRQRPILLFFRGTLGFGARTDNRIGLKTNDSLRHQMAQVLRSQAVKSRFPDVVYEATDDNPPTVRTRHEPRQEPYEENMLESTFCLTPSGHTCTSRRFYDAIAAGCLPIIVDCEWNPAPFDHGIDYTQFVGFYPIQAIESAPFAFLHCLRRLSQDSNLMSGWRSALREARQEVSYGWWSKPLNTSATLADLIRSGEWMLGQSGKVFDNLIASAAMDPARRSLYGRWRDRDVIRKGRWRAFNLTQLCTSERMVSPPQS